MRSLTVQIPTPCHERWAGMQPDGQGRFCASCRKTVVDYTAFSDRELARVLNKPLATTCGRFRTEQLNRSLVIPSVAVVPVWRHWASLLTMGLFSWQTARAQLNQADQSPQPTMLVPRSPFATQPAHTTDRRMQSVTGRLLILDMNGKTSPVPTANVLLIKLNPNDPRTGELMEARTDGAGVFRTEIPADWPVNDLTLDIYTSEFSVRAVKVNVVSSTTALSTLSDVLLNETMCVKKMSITGGGLTVSKSPSRWQKFKRRLFHKSR